MQRIEAWFQGGIFIRCRGQRKFIRCRGQEENLSGKFIIYRGKRHGSRGSMSDMISVLHQSVAINAKGGDC
jgi:hypothetical protein